VKVDVWPCKHGISHCKRRNCLFSDQGHKSIHVCAWNSASKSLCFPGQTLQ